MRKKITAALIAFLTAFSISGCSKKDSSSSDDTKTTEETSQTETTSVTEITTEAADTNLSAASEITDGMVSKFDVGQTLKNENGSNCLALPLAHFIYQGDRINSLTFAIHSDNGNIGELKYGCGISVDDKCPLLNNIRWFQDDDMSVTIQGTEGEVVWTLPDDAAAHVLFDGSMLFGFWWSDVDSIVVDSITCNYTEAKNVPVESTSQNTEGDDTSDESTTLNTDETAATDSEITEDNTELQE